MLTIDAVVTILEVPVTVVLAVNVFVTVEDALPIVVVTNVGAVVAAVVTPRVADGVKVVTTVVTPPPPPPETGGSNGSRWKTPARGFVTPVGPAPTAQPSCVPFTMTEFIAKPGAIGGEITVLVQIWPSQ